MKATVIVNIQLTSILNMDGNPTEKDFQAVRDIAGFYAKTLKEAGADDAIVTDTKIFTHEGDSNDSSRNA